MTAVRQNDRGQATIETLLLSWIVIALFAAVYQLFLVNESIYRATTAAHHQVFDRGFARNKPDCDYTTDQADNCAPSARVIWAAEDGVPESSVPILPIFRRFGLTDHIELRSNVRADGRKRTKMGSGTEMGLFDGLWFAVENGLDLGGWGDQLGDIDTVVSSVLGMLDSILGL
jgi:hypothetical protein